MSISKIKLLQSKMNPPKINETYIVREKLMYELINMPYKAIVLHAPVGTGKTVIVGQCTKKIENQFGWYNLDKYDNDIFTFYRYTITMILELLPDFQFEPSYEMRKLEDCQKGFREFMINLSLHIKENPRQNYYIVFDNLQDINNDMIFTMLQMFIMNLPDCFKVFLITNDSLPECITRHIIGGTCGIYASELNFTQEETQQVCKRVLGYEENMIANEIYRVVDGWPAITMMLSLYLRDNMIVGEKLDWQAIVNESKLHGYINYEIYKKLPDKVREFLAKSTLVEPFNLQICENILNIEEASESVKYLMDRELFLKCSKRQYGEYVYNGVFKIFLSGLVSVSDREAIINKVIDYYLKEEDIMSATEYAISIRNARVVRNILENSGILALESGQYEICKKCFNFLQKEKLELNDTCCGVIAQYNYAIGNYDSMENYLNRADSMFGKENRYSAYRSLYRGLLKYKEDGIESSKKINNALFFLKENNLKLPYLKEEEAQILQSFSHENTLEQDKLKRVRVSTFGSFKVTIMGEGKELSWRTKKGCELFAYLVALKGESVDRRQLLQELWSNEIPDNAVVMLHNMFYNIRKELAAYSLDTIIEYKNKKYSLSREVIQADLEEIVEICSAIEKDNLETLIRNEKRLKKYWGRYLEDIDSEWSMDKREYFDNMYMKGCIILANKHREKEEYNEAILFIKNALSVDSYSEELMSLLIICYGAIGDLKRIKRRYDDFVKLLNVDLGIEPGAKLKAIYKNSIKRDH